MSELKHYETDILTTAYAKPDAYGSLAMPVYYTAAYEFPSAKAMSDAFCGRSMEHSYSRISNPTVQHLERRVRHFTGALSVTALNTGMAAINNTLIAVAKQGTNIVTSAHLFGNTYSFLHTTLAQFGVEVRDADLTDLEATERLMDENTCALFLEIITNPQMEVADLGALSELAHRHSVPVIADTTIVPFTVFHAKDFGVDIEVISSTKYISGGATGLGGLIIDYGTFDWSTSPNINLAWRSKRIGDKVAFSARLKTEILTNMGALMTPQVAYMQNLGLETLQLRFQRQASSALWLARQLQNVEDIKNVNYTGLDDNPYFEISRRQFGDLPGAMLTIDLADKGQCYRFMDALKVIRRATNLFDNKSLAIHPSSTIFGLFNDVQKQAMDVRDTTVRLSIGLEDKEDLLADIVQAVKASQVENV